MSNLDKLLYLTGVAADYLDYSGHRQQLPWERRLEVLRVAGYRPEDSAAVDSAAFELDARPWLQWLQPFNVVDQATPELWIRLHPDQLGQSLDWQLCCEDGTEFKGTVLPAELVEAGDYYIDQVRYSARNWTLPGDIPSGYHQLTLTNGETFAQATVAVCPQRGYSQIDDASEKIWGIACQLYTLRSERNWGVGDFRDLSELIDLVVGQGADMIGLNPLHAPLSDNADTPSPYSPSDRRLLSPLYIDPEQVPEYRASADISRLERDPAFVQELADLRTLELVDYDRVLRCKYKVFELMYSQLLKAGQKTSERWQALRQFVAKQGELLQQFCEYEIQHNRYARAYQKDAGFYQYLQWLASDQLRQCQQQATRRGMRIGLLGDLAVGSVAEGCEVQANPRLYHRDVTIGAPPDPFSETGQNWNLPVLNPVQLRQSGYAHFIGLLRTNMRNVGALRIDHIMALMRLWWCLPGEEGSDARNGIYVYYPLRELMALLRLESHRNRCLVVGEDLGVVPVELREQMTQSRIYSNNLLYFEQDYEGRFFAPGHQQADALLMITNHDVPSLADWWSGEDLRRRDQLGLFSPEVFEQEQSQRAHHRYTLLQWLQHHHVLPAGWGPNDVDHPFDFDLSEAIHRLCGRSQSQLLLVQLEDLQMDLPPVNIPGTHLQYPNWRRKQSIDTAELFETEQAQRIFSAVNKERKH
ncbi:4-alpha-glucanotransferase [Pseudomaricurvus alkylphenolicus]|uniref:4-alpha-glucanotransferase n=1 Tax=Pseudomaricurvus alkylphenolicus TaxID=1306991 RepID=UPI001421F253|nr:4-alpha-glucanotransferase [Pseudomaricurvus alkylphenolicus]NIB41013.1 4-alpha-glucanotransferase [Pseudomaricurvus alkylphenolicus]